MNAARWFMRREDYQPPQTPAESPFRRFKVSCLACHSYRTRLEAHFDEDTGEMTLLLVCLRCHQREKLNAGI
jgi:mono/diheme cytochrome c family protein